MESLQREDGLNCSEKIAYFYNYFGLVTRIIHGKGLLVFGTIDSILWSSPFQAKVKGSLDLAGH